MITNEEVLKEPKDLTLEIENDDELKRLNLNLNNNNIIKEQKNNKYEEIPFIYNEKKIIGIILLMLFLSTVLFFILLKFINIPKIEIKRNNDIDNDTIEEKDINLDNIKLERKIKIAFVYSTLYANGIARFITVAANYFIKTGKYEIYIITEKKSSNEYKYDERINRIIEKDKDKLKNKIKYLNIDFLYCKMYQEEKR